MRWTAPLACAGLTAIAYAQAPAFDVASLKPVQITGGVYSANLGTARHGEVKLTNATLSDCLRFAYGITNDAQIATPDRGLDWIRNKDVRFDIVAKAPPQTPVDQLHLMLQTLLIERFKLVLHREPKELPCLSLIIGKNGLKITAAKDGSTAGTGPQIPGRIISNRMPMSVLATLLSRFLRQTVLDQTGLTGPYDIHLEWTPEGREKETPIAADPPTIFTAVQEQLGLKLEARKVPVEILVIDHAEKTPSQN